MSTKRAAWLLGAVLSSGAALAEAPHSHGVASLDVSIEGRALSLEFRAPLEDVLGFERKPASARDRAAFEAIAMYLKGGRGFVPNIGANCRPADSSVDVEERGSGHFELAARLAYDCKEPDSLAEIEAAVFGQYRKIKRIDVRAVTGKGQSSARLTPAKPRLKL